MFLSPKKIKNDEFFLSSALRKLGMYGQDKEVWDCIHCQTRYLREEYVFADVVEDVSMEDEFMFLNELQDVFVQTMFYYRICLYRKDVEMFIESQCQTLEYDSGTLRNCVTAIFKEVDEKRVASGRTFQDRNV